MARQQLVKRTHILAYNPNLMGFGNRRLLV